MKDYIEMKDLEVGARYEVNARNFNEAIWNGKEFRGMRTKFGQTYEAGELHWDDDPHYGTVKPIKKLGV